MLEDHHYLFRLRTACVAQPQLNAHQLAALNHVMAIAGRSNSIEQFLDSTAGLLEIARGASLDRAWNLRESALRMDDPWLAAAASIEYRHALTGSTHAELSVALQQGQAAGAESRENSGHVSSCFKRLFGCLLMLHTCSIPSAEHELEVRYCIAQLFHLDPAFRPLAWLEQPRYRWRIPWSTGVVHAWLEEYWPTEMSDGAGLPDPGIEQDRARWFSCLERYEGQWPKALPLDIPASFGIADEILKRQQLWPNQWLARHAREARSAIAAATTSIGRESISMERSMSYDIESTWNQLLLSSLLAPLRAAAFEALTGGEGLSRSMETSRALTGLCSHELLHLPAVQAFLKENLEPHLESGLEGLSAFDGEAGFDLLQAALAMRQAGRAIDFEGMLPKQECSSAVWPILYRGDAFPLKGYGVES